MKEWVRDICIVCFKLSAVLPDELYLKIVYRLRVHKKLNLKNPTTYNEKIQRMKLEDHNPLYPVLADKYEVRSYVKERIGGEYLSELYGVYQSEEEIPFDTLPDQFVLKATHDSGGLIIVKDKSELDIRKAKKKLHKCLKRNFYWKGREWCYKDIKPRIICEEFLSDPVSGDLMDYKFLCFHGTPRMLLLVSERQGDAKPKYDFFDMDFNHQPFQRSSGPNSSKTLRKPEGFEQMKELAARLADGLEQVRVDFYNINGKIYFGEMTLYDAGGLKRYTPYKWDAIIGSWW